MSCVLHKSGKMYMFMWVFLYFINFLRQLLRVLCNDYHSLGGRVFL